MRPMTERVIAVVDDDTRVLESLKDLLESAGHTVHLFNFAQALLDNDAFGEIECLISDIGMPAIDGFDLERLAHASRPELPVILITGRIELIEGRATTGRGESRNILLKPFSERQLFGAINRALAPRT